MKSAYLYTLDDPRTDEIRYVGQTVCPAGRLVRHCKVNTSEKNYLANWVRSLQAAGVQPRMTLRVRCQDPAEAKALEVRAIAAFRGKGYRLVNMSAGGEGASGVRRTPEQRTAQGNRQRGQKHSPEWCAAISAGHRAAAWKHSPAALMKMRGRRLTPEQRAAMSIRLKGRKRGPRPAAQVAQSWVTRRERYGQNGRSAERSAESRARHSAVMKARWADPESRARHSAVMKVAMNHPDVKVRASIRQSAVMKARWEARRQQKGAQ